eukprot:g47.t1
MLGQLDKRKRKRTVGGGASRGPPPLGTLNMKYSAYDPGAAQAAELGRSKPSALIEEVARGPPKQAKFAPPRIIEFLDLGRNTAQIHSTVDVDQPLFQPFPLQLVFDEYTPCGVHQKTLYFRNNDSVARRIKILPPESPFFEISAPRSARRNQPLLDGKVAAGMEVCYTVTFKPQEKREYKLELVCSTEREKFVVPISAPGTMAALNFPDDMDFGVCPVKVPSSKTLVVRNVGTRASKFLLKATPPFSIEPSDIYAAVNSSAQVEVVFLPEESGEYEGEVHIEDEAGKQSFMRVTGLAENVNVYLGAPSVEPDPAYISLSSRKSVKIFNRSEFPAKFSIKAFATKQEEWEERARLCEELSRMEQLEMANALQGEAAEEDMDEDDELSGDEGGSAALQLQQAVIRRKYSNLRKAVEEDKMIFVDENFQIEPIEGEIWANSEMELTLTFRPQTAAEYDCVAFVDVQGRDTRLPLQLLGKGIGPKAALSFDVLDIGDVFVNSVHKYEITLENCGDVPCTYALQPSNTPFGPKFSFEPSRGTLEVHDKHVVTVTFCSDILGEFSEHFNFKLQGSDEPLSVHFKGHVVGPTFHFDVEELDYGIVSFDFLKTKTLTLMNTSEIEMRFALRVPQDGTMLKKEFNIEPQNGTLAAGARQSIAVDFTSQTVKKYDYYLTVDVAGVGEGLLSVPIVAECQVPDVRVEKDDVEFGECFMRYPYQQTLTLVNESDLFAKYEVVEQDEYSQAVASYEADAFKGSIPPYGRHDIGLTMVCEKLGKLRLPLSIKIAGSADPPMLATVSAVGKGPNVVLSNESLEWGKKVCLKDHVKMLGMHNDSLIPAQFRAFIKGTRSKFRISPRDGVMQPGEKMDMKVTGHFDDIVAFKDAIQLTVVEGANLLIPLTAKGVGTTMFCEDDLSNIDFGYQLTNKVCEWKTVLENKGRRVQTLTWVNKTLIQKFSSAKAKEKRDAQLVASGKKKKKAKPAVVEPTFTVVPESVELRPRTMCQFTFRGLWKHPEDVTELLVLEAKIGKTVQDAFQCNVKGNFINPLLEPSSPALNFNYTYSPDEGEATPEIQTQLLTLKNVSELPLTFVLRADEPFSIDVSDASLEPQESMTIKVDFEPGYRNDRQSHDIDTSIFCVYRDHPQKDKFPLLAEINFPNLEFEYTKVDFGCILNDTTKSLVTKVKNCSRVPTSFQWAFIEPDPKQSRGEATQRTARSTARSARARPHIPINQVFDILPIHAYLQPGQEEEVEFVYYGHADRKFKGQVVCEVEGGPEYELALAGEAGIVNQNLDVPFLDFGDQPYDKTETREFQIINTGKVSFPFHIRTDKLSSQDVVQVQPSSGRVFANDRQHIQVRFRPGYPCRIREILTVELGHFEPVAFPVMGRGVYTSVAMSLPRAPLAQKPQWVRGDEPYDPVSWEDLVERARGEMLDEAQRDAAQQKAMQLVQQGLDQGVINNERAQALKAHIQTAPAVSEQIMARIEDELGELARVESSASLRPASRMTAKSGKSVTLATIDASDSANTRGSPGALSQMIGQRPMSPGAMSGVARSQTGTMRTGITASLQMNEIAVALEHNADRLYFKDHLHAEQKRADREAEIEAARVAELGQGEGIDGEQADDADETFVAPEDAALAADSIVPPLELDSTAPSAPPAAPGSAPRATKSKKKRKKKDANPFVLSQFICDMHNVVHLSTKTKKFRLVNSGKLPVSFTLDKKLAEASGFSLDPEKVVRLPEGEHVDFEIVFDANAEIPFGQAEVQLPMLWKNGPLVNLLLRANVTVPDVALSHHRLSFDQVLVGRAKVMYTQLHNPSPVPAEWGFKKPMGSVKDLPHFTTNPSSGTLMPNERVNVAIEFEPKESREYSIRLPIKVQNNAHSKENLRLDGIGAEFSLQFTTPTPGLAEFGPVLPYENGNALQTVPVSMTNDSPYPMEVYSLDFDEVHLHEEDIMRRADGYDENDLMRCIVREPGNLLPAHILAAEEKRLARLAAEEAKAKALKRVEEEGITEEEALEGIDLSALEEEVEVVVPDPTARDDGDAHDYVVTGPPCSGKTTMAKLLAEEKRNIFGADIAFVTLDAVVEQALELKDELGLHTRTALFKLTEDDIAAMEAEEGAPAAKAARRASANPPEDAYLSTEQLISVLRWRVQQRDCGSGIVVDDVACKYVASPAVSATALGQTLARDQQWPAQLLVLSPDEAAYSDLLERVQQHVDAVLATPAPDDANDNGTEAGAEAADGDAADEWKELSEEEVAALDDDARNDYNAEVARRAEAAAAAAEAERLRETAVAEAQRMQTRLRVVRDERTTLGIGQPDADTEEKTEDEQKDGDKETADDAVEPAEPKQTVYDSNLPAVIEGWKAADLIVDGDAFDFKTDEELAEMDEETRAAYDAALADFNASNVQDEGDDSAADAGTDDKEQQATELGDDSGTAAGDVPEGDGVVAEVGTTGDEAAAPRVEDAVAENVEMHPVINVAFSAGNRQHRVFNALMAELLPETKAEEEYIPPIPDPETQMLVRRPIERPARPSEHRFTIVVPPPATDPNEEVDEDAKKEEEAKKAKDKKGKKGKGEPEPEEEEPKVLPPKPLRWILQPGETANFDVTFHSTDVGLFDQSLRFEAVGGSQEFNLRVQGDCSVPTIKDDPRNVFMNRIKQRPDHINVSKKFVTNRGQYEFGPLLIKKDTALRLGDDADNAPPAEARQAAALANAETFLISNNGRTPVHVDFCFDSDGNAASDPTFYALPESLDLAEDETKQLLVWSFPKEPRLYEDCLVCCIEDNPDPVKFPVTCLGSDPTIELAGSWLDEARRALAEAEDMDEEDPERAGAIQAANDMKQAPPVIDFDRLLLQRSEDREVLVTNTCTIPVKFDVELGSMEELCREGTDIFEVSPLSGVLNPGQDAAVTVGFRAISSDVHDTGFKIKYSHTEEGYTHTSGVAPSLQKEVDVAVKAEAYALEVVSFEKDGEKGNGELDYGLVRVGERHTERFNICNNGKYDVKFKFDVRRALARELFTIEPTEGTIAPNEKAEVAITFSSSSAITLEGNKDIRCSMMEARTEEEYVEASFGVVASARAEFSKFRLNPLKGINFAALKFNDEAVTKVLELRNDGEFDFTFSAASGQSDAPQMTVYDDDGKMIPPSVETGALTVGQFTIEPAGSTIAPGLKQQVQVTFAPKGHEVFREIVTIGISGRDEEDATMNSALQYELVGESCFPGINTTDFDDIFEEQAVIPKLEPGEEVPGAHFVEQEQRFDFGSIVPSSYPKGVPEKFKIANLQKVPCTVNFSIESEDGDETFAVQPSSCRIMSHEHQYVKVYFKPTAMQRYKARFIATVEDGADTESSKLEFEIGGQGTMPCITVEKPVEKDQGGRCVLGFGRLQQGKRKEMPVVLKNNGIVPATVMFSLPGHDEFSIAGASSSVELARGQSTTLTAAFHPFKPHDKPTECELKLHVQHNPYDDYTFALTGQGFYADVTFEDLGDGEADELVFKDLDLESSNDSKRQTAFSIQSHADVPVRFSWGDAESITFAPSVGHLHPGQKKRIFATFASDKAVALKQKGVKLAFQRIAFTSEAATDWDDRMMVVRYLTEAQLAARKAEAGDAGEDAAQGAGEDNGGDPYRVREVAPEPPHEFLEGSKEETTELRCTAIADKVSFKCDASNVAFLPTSMFQTRLHKFTVQNTSKAKLEYEWNFESLFTPDSRPATAATAKTAAQAPPNPYVVEPAAGVIAAGEEQRFTVSFTPLEVDDFKYRLQADVRGLPADASPLALFLRGRATRPICHFDLPESDYLQRRQAGLPGPTGELGTLDPSVHVVEFESLGTRVRNTKRFCVINPQNVSYEFTWTPVGLPNPAFRCATPSGMMLPGRRSEFIFEFTPDSVGAAEAFYRFSVPSQGVNELFVMTGNVTDPRVYLNRNRIDFTALLVGGKSSETVYVVNKEHIPFDFAFDRSSFDFGARARPQITMHPSSGVVPPEGRTAVEVTFAPTEEKAQNYNVPCNIRRKATKLSLNIKGEGYAIHPRLELQDDDEVPVELTSKRGELNFVDLDTVHVGEKVSKNIVLYNTGKFNYEYSWEALRAKNPMLKITPTTGMVPKGDKVVCTLLFNPVEEIALDDFRIACTVAESRRFVLSVNARAVAYAVNFSFMQAEFGACFVGSAGAPPQTETKVLTITNQEMDEEVSIECPFESTPELEVDFKPALLAAGEMLQVPFVFKPRELMPYNLTVPFVINSTSSVNVSVTGEGAMAKVELASPMMQQVSFGTVQAGQEVSRRVTIVNRAKRVAEFELVDPEVAGRGALAQRAISFFPTGIIPLRPRESMEVELTFAPQVRVPAFSEELQLRVAGTTRKLLSVSGMAQGMEVTLDTDTLPFGSVCEQSHVTRHVQMENTGDMVTKFHWDERALAPHFSISPIEGMLRPLSGQKFEVTFRPTRIDDDIRHEGVTCYLQGAEHVTLTLTGACIAQPDSDVHELSFEAPARSEQSQKVSVTNTSEKPWMLVPVLDGEHWRRSSETLEVPPKGSADFEVIYHPLGMTAGDGEEHVGSLFIALPNGGATLYKLKGSATEPADEEAVELEAVAKVPQNIVLKPTNWLREAQRFTVGIEPSTDEGDMATFWEAAEVHNLPAQGTRELTVKFVSHKEGTRSAYVTLRNEESGEYLKYKITVTVTAPGTLRTIELDVPVRQLATKVITIDNPLLGDDGQRSAVTLADGDEWWTCSHDRVRVRQLGEMSGLDEGSFEVSYRPLVPEELEADLEIIIAELGAFRYKLKLSGTPAGLERVLDFKAPLGGTLQREFRFKSFSPNSATFTCSVSDAAAFSVPASVSAEASDGWNGTEVVLEVSYEPSALGDVTDVLTLKSADAGDYSCKLFGHCTEPQPKGPFTVPKGGSYDLKFKNVFTESKQFAFVSDNRQFTIGSSSASVGPRATQNISVKYQGTDLQPGDKKDGKVLVTCPSMPHIPAWVFYLRGGD